MIDTNNVVSIVRKQDYRDFDLYIDHFNNDRIDIFLTRINYRIGELQYIRGSVRLDQSFSYGVFSSNISRRNPIVIWNDYIVTDDDQLAKIIIDALKTCIHKIDS